LKRLLSGLGGSSDEGISSEIGGSNGEIVALAAGLVGLPDFSLPEFARDVLRMADELEALRTQYADQLQQAEKLNSRLAEIEAELRSVTLEQDSALTVIADFREKAQQVLKMIEGGFKLPGVSTGRGKAATHESQEDPRPPDLEHETPKWQRSLRPP